jgi:quinolinate synthase
MNAPGTLFDRLGPLGYTRDECARLEGLQEKAGELKRRRGAVVLVHNYQRPEIFDLADAIGDSLAMEVKGDLILFAGVHFMAETAKILNPSRRVLIPSLEAGCSLADSVSAPALEARAGELRRQYPDLAVVSYVNTSAAVKAVSDVVCTSGNAERIVNALPNRHVLFVPDRNLAAWVKGRTDKVIIPWEGNCYVHEEVTGAAVAAMKAQHPEAKVMVHPECRPDVTALADAVLSTEGMVEYAKSSPARSFIVVTECGMSDRLQLEMPDRIFYRGCRLCRFMKTISLEDIVDSLEKDRFEVTVPEEVRTRAERAVRRMLELSAAAPAPGAPTAAGPKR